MPKIYIILAVYIVIGLVPALYHTEDSAIFTMKLSEGIGRTAAIGVLSCLGLFYKRNRSLGFGVAASIFTILVIIATLKASQV